MGVVTSPTVSSSERENRISYVVGMPARAVRLRSTAGVMNVGASDVLRVRHWLQVSWITAPLVEAGVVDGQPGRDWPHCQLVSNTVGYSTTLARDSVLPVALLIALTEPRPARVVACFAVNPVPEVSCVNTASSRAVCNQYQRYRRAAARLPRVGATVVNFFHYTRTVQHLYTRVYTSGGSFVQKNLTDRRGQARLDEAMAETTLGKELKRMRGTRSLRAVASEVGISHSLLAQIENEDIDLPRRDTMESLARFYGVQVEYLARLAYCGGRPHLMPATA